MNRLFHPQRKHVRVVCFFFKKKKMYQIFSNTFKYKDRSFAEITAYGNTHLISPTFSSRLISTLSEMETIMSFSIALFRPYHVSQVICTQINKKQEERFLFILMQQQQSAFQHSLLQFPLILRQLKISKHICRLN